MTLDEITDEFLALVKPVFPELEVDHYPGNPEDYKLTHPVGAVLLIFRDRTFSEPDATDGTVQRNQPMVQLTYMNRNLTQTGKDPGVYKLLDRGRDGLAGKSIGHGYIWIRREKLLPRRSGIWIYAQDWQLEDVFIPEVPNE